MIVVAAVGCGGAPDDDAALAVLSQQVEMARVAVVAGDDARAALMVEEIDAAVRRFREQGRISDRRAAAVLAALGDLEAALLVAHRSGTPSS
jgi:hypothetical protein